MVVCFQGHTSLKGGAFKNDFLSMHKAGPLDSVMETLSKSNDPKLYTSMDIKKLCFTIFKTAAREKDAENLKNETELPNNHENPDMAQFHTTDKTLQKNNEREGSGPLAGQGEGTRSSLKAQESIAAQVENVKNSPSTIYEKNNSAADKAATITTTESTSKSPFKIFQTS